MVVDAFDRLRTLALLEPRHRRNRQTYNRGEEDGDQDPTPGQHNGDEAVDVVALGFLSHGQLNDLFEPGLRRPLVGWISDVGFGEGLLDGLAGGVVGKDENVD